MNDPLYDNAKQMAVTWGTFRIAMIQQTFLIGYNRAYRLIDDLMTNGVIDSVPSEDGGYYKAIQLTAGTDTTTQQEK